MFAGKSIKMFGPPIVASGEVATGNAVAVSAAVFAKPMFWFTNPSSIGLVAIVNCTAASY
jgi:hypothetical protein